MDSASTVGRGSIASRALLHYRAIFFFTMAAALGLAQRIDVCRNVRFSAEQHAAKVSP